MILSACSTFSSPTNADDEFDSFEPVHDDRVKELICGSSSSCLESICPNFSECPLKIALSHPVVFVFIDTYSKCDGCNTPDFSPDKGIGKCVEYEILDSEVRFWVSENCNFRYGNPEETRVSVLVNPKQGTTLQIIPSVNYILEPTYCDTVSDCVGLSGSGVPLIGCSNSFYAPLNPTGYYIAEECGCKENRCVINKGQ
jgi:hypothetical protein